MRTLFSLAASLTAFVVLTTSPAFAQTAVETTPFDLMTVSLSESVEELSQVVSSHGAVMEDELERLDDAARFQRILARRGKKPEVRWTAPEPAVASAEVFEAPQPFYQVSEASVSYGDYTGQADPLIVKTIMEFNLEITEPKAKKLARLIQATADRYSVDPLLVTALVSQESAFYQSAVSPVGATGLGQLMPETAADLGVNPNNAVENLDGSVRYLADLLYYWSGSEDPTALALASYNAGAGNVERYDGIPPFEETQNYVVVIKDRYAVLSSGQTVFGS